MDKNCLYRDPENQGSGVLPDLIPVTLSSCGCRMFGFMFTAQGEGPHPTMILIHGFPGNECNFDLAHALRRTGWNVFVFHYRGTWGSKGTFSFSNMLEDIQASAEFIRTEAAKERFRIDDRNLVLAGNSVGGFAALLSTARGIGVKGCVSISSYDIGLMGKVVQGDADAMAAVRNMFTECIEPTEGTTVDELIDEIIANCEDWNLLNYAGELAQHPVLLLAGARDDVGPADVHFYPLIDAIMPNCPENLEYHLLESDHGFQDKRIQLSEIIGAWLEKLV